MTEIDSFYIITRDGICIYSWFRSNELDEQLFAGFMSAINSFSRVLTNESLNGFILGNSRCFISTSNTLMFVAVTPAGEKEGNILKKLNEIQKKFFQRYPITLFDKHWENKIIHDSELDEELSQFFMNTLEKLQAAIW